MPSCWATLRAVISISASTSACSASTVAAFSMCSFGTTRTWVGAPGLMSRKAKVRSVESTSVEGISPATMRQNKQSLTGRTLPSAPVDQGDRDAGAEGVTGEVDALLADLARWMGDERVRDAAEARSRRRWLQQQAAESATFTG